MKKILVVMFCFVLIFSLNFVNAETYLARFDAGGGGLGSYDSGTGITYPSNPRYDNGVISGVTNLADRVWATAITIIQALAIGCVVFAGLRYMYASADKKADIKKGMMYLAIGSIFVFATTTVIRFIYNIGIGLL